MKFKLVENFKIPSEVYHYTSLDKFISIVNENKFIPGPWNNLSVTTRTDTPYFTNNIQNVLITLDGNKLSSKYKGRKYDSTSGNDGVDWEEEIRFEVNSPITDFLSYVKSVTLHKELQTDQVIQLYLQKLGFKTYTELIKSVKTKISDIKLESITGDVKMKIKKLNENTQIESKTMKEDYREDSPDNTYKIGDRVAQRWTDEFNVGTVVDIKEEDGIQYLVEWDYSDGPDVEWVYGDAISYWIEENDSISESKESKESELITQYINNGEFDKLEKVQDGTNVIWKLKEPIEESLGKCDKCGKDLVAGEGEEPHCPECSQTHDFYEESLTEDMSIQEKLALHKKVHEAVMSAIDEALDNFAISLKTKLPDYNPEWCSEVRDKEFEDVKKVQNTFALAVADSLLKGMDNEVSESLTEDVDTVPMEGPKEGPESGLSALLNSAIQEELKTVDSYNSLAITARAEGFEDIARMVNEINTEENKHIGQLQEALKSISPNALAIEDGTAEGQEQMSNAIMVDDDLSDDELGMLLFKLR